jgi:hypothetical protein
MEALKTLGWVFLLLALFIYACGIYMTLIVGQQCADKYESWHECRDVFGSVPASMYSLFQVLTLESWSMLIARPVLKKKAWLFLFFLFFLMFTTFGLLNIIVGVIVENTLKASDAEQHSKEIARDEEMHRELLELRRVFEEADEDNNGNVDIEEFTAILQKYWVVEKLQRFDIPCSDPAQLFEMLDQDGSEVLSIFEFVNGISRLRTSPSASTLRTAATQIACAVEAFPQIMDGFDEVLKAMNIKDEVCPRQNNSEAKLARRGTLRSNGAHRGSSASSMSSSPKNSRQRRKSLANALVTGHHLLLDPLQLPPSPRTLFNFGDKVRILKDGQLTGDLASVVDPDSNGFIKVQIEDTNEVDGGLCSPKFFKPSELALVSEEKEKDEEDMHITPPKLSSVSVASRSMNVAAGQSSWDNCMNIDSAKNTAASGLVVHAAVAMPGTARTEASGSFSNDAGLRHFPDSSNHSLAHLQAMEQSFDKRLVNLERLASELKRSQHKIREGIEEVKHRFSPLRKEASSS